MRIVLPALVIAGAVSPAAALAAEGDAARVAEELNDPLRQEQMARTAEAVTTAVLDVPVGPLMRAAKTIAGEDPDYVDPDLRVGDVVGPEAADVPYELAHRLPQMMGALATAAASLEAMLPELRAMGDRIAEDMADDWAEDLARDRYE
jgi:hypothetical protein